MKSKEELLKLTEETIKDELFMGVYIRDRYLDWIEKINKYPLSSIGKEEKFLANKIILKMTEYEMNFKLACMILGYVRKLLWIEEDYINGMGIEDIYAKKCLPIEFIELAKSIAYFIRNQDEVYANIQGVFLEIYKELLELTKKISLWHGSQDKDYKRD